MPINQEKNAAIQYVAKRLVDYLVTKKVGFLVLDSDGTNTLHTFYNEFIAQYFFNGTYRAGNLKVKKERRDDLEKIFLNPTFFRAVLQEMEKKGIVPVIMSRQYEDPLNDIYGISYTNQNGDSTTIKDHIKSEGGAIIGVDTIKADLYVDGQKIELTCGREKPEMIRDLMRELQRLRPGAKIMVADDAEAEKVAEENPEVICLGGEGTFCDQGKIYKENQVGRYQYLEDGVFSENRDLLFYGLSSVADRVAALYNGRTINETKVKGYGEITIDGLTKEDEEGNLVAGQCSGFSPASVVDFLRQQRVFIDEDIAKNADVASTMEAFENYTSFGRNINKSKAQEVAPPPRPSAPKPSFQGGVSAIAMTPNPFYFDDGAPTITPRKPQLPSKDAADEALRAALQSLKISNPGKESSETPPPRPPKSSLPKSSSPVFDPDGRSPYLVQMGEPEKKETEEERIVRFALEEAKKEITGIGKHFVLMGDPGFLSRVESKKEETMKNIDKIAHGYVTQNKTLNQVEEETGRTLDYRTKELVQAKMDQMMKAVERHANYVLSKGCTNLDQFEEKTGQRFEDRMQRLVQAKMDQILEGRSDNEVKDVFKRSGAVRRVTAPSSAASSRNGSAQESVTSATEWSSPTSSAASSRNESAQEEGSIALINPSMEATGGSAKNPPLIPPREGKNPSPNPAPSGADFVASQKEQGK